MISLNDVLDANKLLMSMGAEDQIPKIAAKAIERSLELQNRVERALAYAAQSPPNSTHARNMARILDGSITLDDELNEIAENNLAEPRKLRAVHAKPEPKAEKVKGKLSPGKGLAGRSTEERLKIREWIAEQGYDIAPSGRIHQSYLDQYDETQRLLREHRRANHQAQAFDLG